MKTTNQPTLSEAELATLQKILPPFLEQKKQELQPFLEKLKAKKKISK